MNKETNSYFQEADLHYLDLLNEVGALNISQEEIMNLPIGLLVALNQNPLASYFIRKKTELVTAITQFMPDEEDYLAYNTACFFYLLFASGRISKEIFDQNLPLVYDYGQEHSAFTFSDKKTRQPIFDFVDYLVYDPKLRTVCEQYQSEKINNINDIYENKLVWRLRPILKNARMIDDILSDFFNQCQQYDLTLGKYQIGVPANCDELVKLSVLMENSLEEIFINDTITKSDEQFLKSRGVISVKIEKSGQKYEFVLGLKSQSIQEIYACEEDNSSQEIKDYIEDLLASEQGFSCEKKIFERISRYE